MTTTEFLNEFVSKQSHKSERTVSEYKRIQGQGLMIKATTFYQIYKELVREHLDLRDFYRVCGQYFYYDKYICEHGTEYYYHVIFNKDNKIYELVSPMIIRQVRANAPETLWDVVKVVTAV